MTASSLSQLSPNAEIVSKQEAFQVNAAAAIGLCHVMQSNLGPTGSLKLLVGGTLEQLKLTKDGTTLLKEMQIQHPTAALIARTATAQDEICGDGTTSVVLLVGELLRCSQTSSGGTLHPRHLTDGYDLARTAVLEFLQDHFAMPLTLPKDDDDDDTNETIFSLNRELLVNVAKTSLGTKLDKGLVHKLSAAVVNAMETIYQTDVPLDLNRIEIMTQTRKHAIDSRLVKGLVLDHGGRHPDMPNQLGSDNADGIHKRGGVYIMICNVSLEYEQTETQSGFVYSTAEQREKLVESERTWLDERCRKIVALKRKVCTPENKMSFCIINQKGVDPLSLDIFAKEGILCLRRAKRRNMERLSLATGGQVILSLADDDLDESMLGYAGRVTQVTYGDDKYTFVEDCPTDASKSCTMMLQGPNDMTIAQIKDAVKDGLRAVKNVVEDKAVIPGGGAFELAASMYLTSEILPKTKGKKKLGIQAYAEALLIIPKTLIANSGFDVQDVLLQLKEERETSGDTYEDMAKVGFNCATGEPMLPEMEGIYDSVRVKRQSLHLCTVLANQLLLVDEVMRAGKQMGRPQEPGPEM